MVSWSKEYHSRTRRTCLALLIGLTTAAFSGGCGGAGLPDVRVAARAYQAALTRGDAHAIHDMMSEGSQRAYRVGDVANIVKDERAELLERSQAFTHAASAVRTTARVRLASGDEALLDVENGAYRVSSSGGFPAAARTPAQALQQLRTALARRSYATLLRVLSPATRAAIESDIRALIEGLTYPEGLQVQIAGDVASVQIEGGHFVRLRLDGGVWKVEDFD